MKTLRICLQILIPLAILVGGAALANWIRAQKPTPKVEATTFSAPAVRTHVVTVEDVRIDVEAQGVVEPFREIDLSAQVGGRVLAISPALRAGGFFAADAVLAEIDDADYVLAAVQQESAVARAELRLLQEKAEAEAALRAWREIEGDRPAGPLVTREAQIGEAEKALAAARAQLERCRLDLERVHVRAPFAGRVRTAHVDVGQIVQPGAPLARIYGTDAAEVRLPLPASDTAFLDLPLHWSDGGADTATGPRVELSAEFGGRRHTWDAVITRTEGEVDRKTRQLAVIARVDSPYARGEHPDRPPLAIGTFVDARITGRTYAQIAVVPRTALDENREVWIVDAEHRLQRRKVDVLRETTDLVYLRHGVDAGEVVVTTRLDAAVDGMPVRLFTEPQR